ncbi:hypothetical protein E2C01_000743 [Portunus trituberculatus]|uniref:Uncharacterized protein n=1 Tax=Portunus trituberculatus TaxID=210409 RepID=A0A5B7CIF6_PORTR|nr:hypothetical protein [Portunus trituberculatus]
MHAYSRRTSPSLQSLTTNRDITSSEDTFDSVVSYPHRFGGRDDGHSTVGYHTPCLTDTTQSQGFPKRQ